jgi:hypothetical protein
MAKRVKIAMPRIEGVVGAVMEEPQRDPDRMED